MNLQHLRYPTFEEIAAIERAARSARARVLARLFSGAACWLLELVARAAALAADKIRGSTAPVRRAA